jgi:hypothetical protein
MNISQSMILYHFLLVGWTKNSFHSEVASKGFLINSCYLCHLWTSYFFFFVFFLVHVFISTGKVQVLTFFSCNFCVTIFLNFYFLFLQLCLFVWLCKCSFFHGKITSNDNFSVKFLYIFLQVFMYLFVCVDVSSNPSWSYKW